MPVQTKHPAIPITEDDLKKIIYFILIKFRGDSLHMQGTSAKRDLVGGYIERWFNKIAESVIFDELLKNKSYKVVPDYFVYSNDSEKNAPDIIGLDTSEGETIPFVKYKNGTWVNVPKMPRVEVKVVRQDQVLLGVREPQMIDDYYVFIESDLEPDYLTAIFEDSVFDDKYFKELEMSRDFIESDDDNQIIPHLKMEPSNSIGTMRLVGIYTKDELRKNTAMCKRGVSPYYFSEAVNIERVIGAKNGEPIKVGKDGKVHYAGIDKSIYLPFSIDGAEGKELKVLKRNKGSVYIEAENDLFIDGNKVSSGLVKISFKRFERSSSWDENIASKVMLEKYGEDATEELVGIFDKIVGTVVKS